MPRFGFCGGSYQSEIPLADLQSSINFYPEATENPGSRTSMILLPTPGLSLYATLIGPSVRGSYVINGRTFKVSGTHLYELGAGGVVTDYGGNPGTANNNIVDDGNPAVMVAGGTDSGQYPGQLAIASGGSLTVFSLASNTFKAITGAPVNVLMVEFQDGFFVALTAGNTFQASQVEDATTWSGLSVSNVSVYSDALLSIISDHRFLWVFGGKRAVAYYTSGGALFPFDVVNGGFVEMGILAQFSPARVNNTIYWLAGDERGESVVVRANGFMPQRVSDHGFEYWMQSQKVGITDAVGWGTREEGHNFYHLWFRAANATWTLDTDLGLWHQRSSLIAGAPSAHLSRCHSYNFGLHLVGDRTSGKVYAMNSSYLTDNGAAIIRTRIGPTISKESQWIFINEFQVDVETGLGPIPALTDALGNPRDPYMMFQYSGDFGKTWGNQRMIACGQAGNYRIRAVDRRLGKWRSFTPKVTVSDPIFWKIADAYYNGTQEAQERLAKQFAKVT
jgi:hypothetical protein